MTEIARAVLAKWMRSGAPSDIGVSDGVLDAFQRDRGVVLPPSMRALWRLSDGTAAMDDDEIAFWPFDNIADDPSLAPRAHPQEHLVFADWRLQARFFVLRFDDGRVDVLGADGTLRVHAVARSFDEFLTRYVLQPQLILRTV